MENCVSRVDISGPATIGGIVGYAHSDSSIQMPMIISCYNAGSVEGNGSEYTGGIAGYKDYNPCQYIKNCYNIGTVSGDNAYGIAISGRGTNRNNYTLLGSAPTAGGTALAADALKTYAETLGDAYMDNPTSYNDGFPILKWEEPRALVVAQKEYPAELDAYKANESYDEAGTVLRTQAVEEGKAAIEAAATLEDAKTALDQAKAVIDAIETVENQDSEEEKVLLGDVNGDDVIDGRDVVRLRKYTAGMEGITIVEVNAEVTGDDIIDGRDVVRLRKFTAGMDDVVLE